MSVQVSGKLGRTGWFCFALVGCVVLAGSSCASAQGTTTTIATTGDQAGETPAGALFSIFVTTPVLNDAGQAAYFASLQTGAGGVDPTNDTGIWRDQTLIVRKGSQASGTPAGALFSFFSNSVLNDAGQTAFSASLQVGVGGIDFSNDVGIWRDQTLIARKGSQASGTPAGALFSGFSNPLLNDAGQTAYKGSLVPGAGGVDLTNDNGIWRDQTLIARSGFQANGTPAGALFSSFSNPVLNNAGQTAYLGLLKTGSGGVDLTNERGIWRDQTLIARSGDQAGGTPAGALFSNLGIPVLNDAGQTAYSAVLQSGAGGVGSSNDNGIWRDQTLIAREGSQAGGTPAGALFSDFLSFVLNDAGQTVYRGFLQSGAGGVELTNDEGIWRDQTLIAREGSQAGGTPAGALFSGFVTPMLNDTGLTAYFASLQSGAGGVDTTNDTGIWITGIDGESLLVAREGDSLAGRTISSLAFSDDSGGSDGRGRGLNNFSQLAYRATFTNGDQGIFLFTPEIHWTSAATGSWDTSSNWILGQLPVDPHDVVIDPTASLTVTGPTGSVTVTNLTIGGGNGMATLSLNGGSITSPNAVVVASTGVLTGDGIISGNVTNNGTVTADNVTITGALTNNSLVSGTGRVNAQLINNPTGEVRVAAGESLIFNAAGANSNSGHIEAIGTAVAPAEIEFNSVVSNNPGSEMFARNALLRFNTGLGNLGSLTMSFGTVDVFGVVNNTGIGTIIASGNSNVTFHDDVDNDGELRTSAGSTTVFFGDVSGSGTFTGSGTVFFEGAFSPGSSPGEVAFGGDVVFGSLSELNIEISGLVTGTEFDVLDIAGDVSLAGTLDVSLLGGFTLGIGNMFEFINVDGALSGTFTGLAEGALVGNFGGTDLFITYTGGDGNDVSLFTAGLDGDYNGNGIVDAADYTVWRDGNSPDSSIAGYNLWVANFGNTSSLSNGSSESANEGGSVPEPTTLLLATLALTGLFRRRKIA